MKSKILVLFTLFSILSPMSVIADSKVACKDWANNRSKDLAIAAEKKAAQSNTTGTSAKSAQSSEAL